MSFLSPLIHLPIQVGSLCPPKISPTDSLGGLHPIPPPSLADPVRHESGLELGPKKGLGRGEEAPGLVGGGPGRGPSLPRSQGTWPGPGRLGLLLRHWEESWLLIGHRNNRRGPEAPARGQRCGRDTSPPRTLPPSRALRGEARARRGPKEGWVWGAEGTGRPSWGWTKAALTAQPRAVPGTQTHLSSCLCLKGPSCSDERTRGGDAHSAPGGTWAQGPPPGCRAGSLLPVPLPCAGPPTCGPHPLPVSDRRRHAQEALQALPGQSHPLWPP